MPVVPHPSRESGPTKQRTGVRPQLYSVRNLPAWGGRERESKHFLPTPPKALAHVTAAQGPGGTPGLTAATPVALHPNGGQVAQSTMRLPVQSLLCMTGIHGKRNGPRSVHLRL